MTVVVGARQAGAPAAVAAEEQVDVLGLVQAMRAGGSTPGAIAKELSRRLGISRHDAYRLLTG